MKRVFSLLNFFRNVSFRHYIKRSMGAAIPFGLDLSSHSKESPSLWKEKEKPFNVYSAKNSCFLIQKEMVVLMQLGNNSLVCSGQMPYTLLRSLMLTIYKG
ncbi:unnamed protein product [Cuscuta campestris]|uniref:Uncharacterized protein n=1 Tax=Cuscuta campestris TaxID=132261 RepID=A0A484N3P6_9ASTE|nr:unnamed protein product [Cuscuta campestris]